MIEERVYIQFDPTIIQVACLDESQGSGWEFTFIYLFQAFLHGAYSNLNKPKLQSECGSCLSPSPGNEEKRMAPAARRRLDPGASPHHLVAWASQSINICWGKKKSSSVRAESKTPLPCCWERGFIKRWNLDTGTGILSERKETPFPERCPDLGVFQQWRRSTALSSACLSCCDWTMASFSKRELEECRWGVDAKESQ